MNSDCVSLGRQVTAPVSSHWRCWWPSSSVQPPAMSARGRLVNSLVPSFVVYLKHWIKSYKTDLLRNFLFLFASYAWNKSLLLKGFDNIWSIVVSCDDHFFWLNNYEFALSFARVVNLGEKRYSVVRVFLHGEDITQRIFRDLNSQ